MNILQNIKNICNNKFFLRILLIFGFCFVTTNVVEAKTINNSNNFIDSNKLDFFKDMYDSLNYRYYLLVPTYVTLNNYSGYNDYYFCLTNKKIERTDFLNVKANCDLMYRYYRSDDSYVLEKYNDNYLEAVNSVNYSSSFISKHLVTSYLLFICVFLCIFFFVKIIIDII